MNSLSLSRNRKNYLTIKIKHKYVSNNIAHQNLLSRVEELETNIRFRYDSISVPGPLLFIPQRWGGKWQGMRRRESLESWLDMADFAGFVLRLLSNLTFSSCVMAWQMLEYFRVFAVRFNWMKNIGNSSTALKRDLPIQERRHLCCDRETESCNRVITRYEIISSFPSEFHFISFFPCFCCFAKLTTVV